MHRSSCRFVAAERARWLAELTAAINDAQRVAWRMSIEKSNPEALELYGRLELARTEVESLRRSGWAESRQNLPSEWTEFLPNGLRLSAQPSES